MRTMWAWLEWLWLALDSVMDWIVTFVTRFNRLERLLSGVSLASYWAGLPLLPSNSPGLHVVEAVAEYFKCNPEESYLIPVLPVRRASNSEEESAAASSAAPHRADEVARKLGVRESLAPALFACLQHIQHRERVHTELVQKSNTKVDANDQHHTQKLKSLWTALAGTPPPPFSLTASDVEYFPASSPPSTGVPTPSGSRDSSSTSSSSSSSSVVRDEGNEDLTTCSGSTTTSSSLGPSQLPVARPFKTWGDLGFQTPLKDFRGVGILGVDCLLHFATKHKRRAVEVLEESRNPSHWFPFATTGINVVSWLLEWMSSGDLNAFFYFEDAAQLDSHSVFATIFSFTLLEFSRFWKLHRPKDIMQFGHVSQKFRSKFKETLHDLSNARAHSEWSITQEAMTGEDLVLELSGWIDGEFVHGDDKAMRKAQPGHVVKQIMGL
eukprot:GHVT01072514.1.p1 GENE.GHVT01072514.1~~GHVT01072514.1.p1  ORF type:complete len:438 (+),score=96.91 GHVT01072514.1:300-1613(+)